MSSENPFEVLERKTLFDSKVFDLIVDTVRVAGKHTSTHYTLTHPGATVILPLTNSGSLYLTKQYRHSLGAYILEFPAGTLEEGEEPQSCAYREIEEEIGFKAKKMEPLGILHPAPGFCTEVQHLFFASELEESSMQHDLDEVIERVEMSIEEFESHITEGKVTDGKTIAIYTRAKLKGFL